MARIRERNGKYQIILELGKGVGGKRKRKYHTCPEGTTEEEAKDIKIRMAMRYENKNIAPDLLEITMQEHLKDCKGERAKHSRKHLCRIFSSRKPAYHPLFWLYEG